MPDTTHPNGGKMQGRVLLVEDDRMSRMLVTGHIEQLGYTVESAGNGVDAYTMLRENPARADIVVSDRMMPVMDGLALTRRIKRDPALQALPVVLLTGAAEAADIADGVAAGAFYYLTKPVEPALLAQVLESARKEIVRTQRIREVLASHQGAFSNMQEVKFALTAPSEVEGVAGLLASLAPVPEKILPGLIDLISNAVEHGRLRIGLEVKQCLMESGQFEAEVQRRLQDSAYGGIVLASAVRAQDGIRFMVKDPGAGFNWRRFIHPDPSRANAASGRGIARAAIIFDRVVYNEEGNLAVALHTPRRAERW